MMFGSNCFCSVCVGVFGRGREGGLSAVGGGGKETN